MPGKQDGEGEEARQGAISEAASGGSLSLVLQGLRRVRDVSELSSHILAPRRAVNSPLSSCGRTAPTAQRPLRESRKRTPGPGRLPAMRRRRMRWDQA